MGVLLPVPVPAPADRAGGARARHPRGLRPADLGDAGRLRGRLRVRRGDRAVRWASRCRTRTPPPQLTDSTLLVRPDLALAQRETGASRSSEAARAPRRQRDGSRDRGISAGGTGTERTAAVRQLAAPSPAADRPGRQPERRAPRPPGRRLTATAPPAPKNIRFYGTVRLDPERYGRDFDRLYQEVIQHLAAPEDVDLEITVEIKAVKKDGFPDDKARIVSENARTLKFDQSGFEDH